MRSAARASRGYTLVALTIGITIMLILITAVLPAASAQQQREREEELIFRGRQWAEGVRCFRRKYGRYPNSLKEMLETRPRTVRKLWKDPITDSNDWGLVTMGTLTPVGTSGSGPGGAPGGGGFGGGFGGVTKATPTPAPSPTPSMFGGSGGDRGGKGSGSGIGGGPPGGGDQPLLPVMGVYSKSRKKAFRVYQGRDVYAEWRFTEATLSQVGSGNDTPGGLPGPGIGGSGGGTGGGPPTKP